MKLVRSLVLSVAVAGGSFALVACGGTVEQPQTSAAAATKAPIGTNTHGLVKLVGEALGEVPLRPDQRAEIEKLAQEAEARHAPMLEGRKELMLAFADQVERGSIDKAALQPKIDRVTAELEKARAEDRAAIVKLHAILDSEQRNAFVDALEDRLKGKRGPHRGELRDGHPPAHAMGGMHHMKKLADDLKLTDEQRDKAHEIMRESMKEAMKQRFGKGGEHHGAPNALRHRGMKGKHGRPGPHGGKHALEAFREDSFDLDAVAPPHDMKAAAAFGVERASAMADKLLPILTPEQRKIAADKLREMANAGDSSLLVH